MKIKDDDDTANHRPPHIAREVPAKTPSDPILLPRELPPLLENPRVPELRFYTATVPNALFHHSTANSNEGRQGIADIAIYQP